MCSSETASSRGAQRGFVLATTLLVTTLLTVMLAASFLLVSTEQRTTDNSLATSQALAIAQAGLQVYFDSARGLDTSSTYDSVRISLPGGFADVVARRVRPAGAAVGSSLALWVVRSSAIASSPVMADQARASRTIAQFAQLNAGVLPARAAMIAINGVQMQSTGTNPVDGYDKCSVKDTIGLTVPANPYGYNPGTGGTSAPKGRPTGIESFGTPTDVLDSTGIDWPSLIGGNLTPNYTVPAGTSWLPSGTGMSQIGYVAGDLTLLAGATGYGLLIVKGDLTVSPSSAWRGVILIGGRLLEQSNSPDYSLQGMVTTGLNLSLGMAVLPDQLTRKGTSAIQWSSCIVGTAIASQSFLVPVKNAWADTWSTY